MSAKKKPSTNTDGQAAVPQPEALPEDLTYAQAAGELDRILEALESGETGIDALALQVARAGALLRFCQEKLRDTELAVNTIIEDLDL